MTPPTILLAGASGDLGARICRALLARGAAVRALVRNNAAPSERGELEAMGAIVVPVDVNNVEAVAKACSGVACVVSALNGLRDVIIDRQGVLLDAAVNAGVPRFMPSDYSADFTKTRPGDNRNFDLRREFMQRADRAPIQVTSIFNGAFMDMLGAEMPTIQPRIRRVLYWRDADQILDFTAKKDVAAYVAAAVLDDTTPRFLKIAGASVTTRDIAATMSALTGERYRPLWVGSITSLGMMIGVAKLLAPAPGVVFPPWQGMQYSRDMFSGRGRLDVLDNSRYPDLRWTSLSEELASKFGRSTIK